MEKATKKSLILDSVEFRTSKSNFRVVSMRVQGEILLPLGQEYGPFCENRRNDNETGRGSLPIHNNEFGRPTPATKKETRRGIRYVPWFIYRKSHSIDILLRGNCLLLVKALAQKVQALWKCGKPLPMTLDRWDPNGYSLCV